MSDYSEIVVLLDRSGSMQSARADHEGGLNSFIEDQKQLAGDVRLTFILFDDKDPCEVVWEGEPIDRVTRCQLIPRGGTPLLDAIGRAVARVRERLDKSERKPDQVVFMVITDGEENSSREFNKQRISDLIKEREAAGWKFIYLGANVDSFSEAHSIGIVQDCALDYTPTSGGISNMYLSASSNTKRARSALAAGASLQTAYANYCFSDDQRASATSPQTGDVQWNSISSQSSSNQQKSSGTTKEPSQP